MGGELTLGGKPKSYDSLVKELLLKQQDAHSFIRLSSSCNSIIFDVSEFMILLHKEKANCESPFSNIKLQVVLNVI